MPGGRAGNRAGAPLSWHAAGGTAILGFEAMTRIGIACLLVAAAAAATARTASAARAPTYLERATIMDTFNIPGRSFSSRCVKILVSNVNPRYAMLASPARPSRACRDAGQVGDGFVFFLRATKTALRWRNIGEGSDVPCSIPQNVRVDLLRTRACA
jgi:hypothetical protein